MCDFVGHIWPFCRTFLAVGHFEHCGHFEPLQASALLYLAVASVPKGPWRHPPIFHTDASNRTVGSFSFRASRVQSRYDAYLGAQPPLYMLNRCRDSLCLSLLQLTVVTFGYGSSSCLLPISCSGFCTAAATALHVMISVGLATRDMSKET